MESIRVCAVFCLMCLGLLGSSAAVAQDGAASTGFKFLTIGGGARAVGLGETMVADGSDPFLVEYNPAGLTGLGRTIAAFSHNRFFQDVRGEYITVGIPAGRWAFGARAGYMGTDGIPLRTGPSEQPLALFDASDGVFQGAVARQVNERLAVGVSAAYVLENIDTRTASSAVFGVGFNYRFNHHLTIGSALLNAGPSATFDQREFSMPRRFSLGGIWRQGVYSLRGEVLAPADENVKWHFGAEVTPDPRLALRAGFKLGYDTQVFAAGFGARTSDGRFGVNYAFAPYSEGFGSTHRFSLTISP